MTEAVNTMARPPHDAELREWASQHHGNHTVVFGRVYGDRKRRWPYGYSIVTTPVQSGGCTEGAVIETRNTRYLLSGPPGDLEAMLELAGHKAANSERRAQVAQDEPLFDLLPAAWGMDDATFEKVAGLPELALAVA